MIRLALGCLAVAYTLYGAAIYLLPRASNTFYDVPRRVSTLQERIYAAQWKADTPGSWKKQVRAISELEPKIDRNQKGMPIFELGCGTGAFLEQMHNDMGPDIRLYGCDINSSALASAPEYIHTLDKPVEDVTLSDVGGVPVSHVVGHGVLIYFPSLDSVRSALDACLRLLALDGTMRFSMMDHPVTLQSFLSFESSVTSGTLRIPVEFFEEYAARNGCSLHVHGAPGRHGQNKRRYCVVLKRRLDPVIRAS